MELELYTYTCTTELASVGLGPMLNDDIVHTTGISALETVPVGAKVSRTLPSYATELLFGIQVAVITGEPTKFVQLVEPGVNEENNNPDTEMDEIAEIEGKRMLNVAVTFWAETATDDNSSNAEDRTPAEITEKTPDALAARTTTLAFKTAARILRSSAWPAEGFDTLDT